MDFGIAIVAIFGGLMVIPPEYYQRIIEMGTAAEEDSSAQSRIVSWLAAIEMAWEYPFTGVGLGCFTIDYFSYAHPDAEEAFVAHSSFFQILGTAGVTGALLWSAIVIRTWQVLGKAERRLRAARLKGSRLHYMVLAIKTSLVAYIVSGAFLSMEDLEFFYYEVGLASAIVLAVNAEIKKRREEEKTSD